MTNNKNDDYLGSGKMITRAVKKYGKCNFIKEILYECSNEKEMDQKERELITLDFCNRKDTYNICEGGYGGGFRYINANTELVALRDKPEYKKMGYLANIENMLKPRKIDPENIKIGQKKYIEKNGRHWNDNRLGKKLTEETIQKMKFSAPNRMGANNNSFGKCWVTNNFENKMILKSEIDKYIELGYIKGRKI